LVILFESIENKDVETVLQKAFLTMHKLKYISFYDFREVSYFLSSYDFESPKLEKLLMARVIK